MGNVNEKNVKDMIDGRVGNTADAASETGGVLAKLTYMAQAVIRGAGTALAAGKSLGDAIGHTGSAHLNTGIDEDTQYLARTAVPDAPVAKTINDYVSHRVPPTYDVRPLLAARTTVTGAVGANAYGAYAEVIAAAGVAVKFWLVGVIAKLDQVDDYYISIGTGGVGVEVEVAALGQEATVAGTDYNLDLPVPIEVAANTRVAVRLATVGGGSDTAKVRLKFATGL